MVLDTYCTHIHTQFLDTYIFVVHLNVAYIFVCGQFVHQLRIEANDNVNFMMLYATKMYAIKHSCFIYVFAINLDEQKSI